MEFVDSLIGQVLRKRFNDDWYIGWIAEFDTARNKYLVIYNDNTRYFVARSEVLDSLLLDHRILSDIAKCQKYYRTLLSKRIKCWIPRKHKPPSVRSQRILSRKQASTQASVPAIEQLNEIINTL